MKRDSQDQRLDELVHFESPMRCPACGRRLFQVVGAYYRIKIKCTRSRCRRITVFQSPEGVVVSGSDGNSSPGGTLVSGGPLP